MSSSLDRLTERQIDLLRAVSRYAGLRAETSGAAEFVFFRRDGSRRPLRVGNPAALAADLHALAGAGFLRVASRRRRSGFVREFVCSRPGLAAAIAIGRAEAFA